MSKDLPELLEQKIQEIAASSSSDFCKLVDIAGLHPATDFRYVNLRGTDFSGCDLRSYSFVGTDLRGCIFENALIYRKAVNEAITDTEISFIKTNASGTFDSSASGIELADSTPKRNIIKVVGLGFGGSNIVGNMNAVDLEGMELHFLSAKVHQYYKLDPRTDVVGGTTIIDKIFDAGYKPALGREEALEGKKGYIAEMLKGADMVFIVAGLGGGTAADAASVVAEVAKSMDVLTVAVVTKPFAFEGKKRRLLAEEGINLLAQSVDSLITIPNDKLLSIMGEDTTLLNAFREVDNILAGVVQGIADLIIRPGMFNVDLAAVRMVMSEMGLAILGSGVASGDQRVRNAAEAAIHSPLLDDIDFNGARGVLVSIAANVDISPAEFWEVATAIEEFSLENATMLLGTVIDPNMGDEVRVTVVAGLGLPEEEKSNVVIENIHVDE